MFGKVKQEVVSRSKREEKDSHCAERKGKQPLAEAKVGASANRRVTYV